MTSFRFLKLTTFRNLKILMRALSLRRASRRAELQAPTWKCGHHRSSTQQNQTSPTLSKSSRLFLSDSTPSPYSPSTLMPRSSLNTRNISLSTLCWICSLMTVCSGSLSWPSYQSYSKQSKHPYHHRMTRWSSSNWIKMSFNKFRTLKRKSCRCSKLTQRPPASQHWSK